MCNKELGSRTKDAHLERSPRAASVGGPASIVRRTVGTVAASLIVTVAVRVGQLALFVAGTG